MPSPLTIWLLGDGKPGHENQSRGLAEALERLRPCQTLRIPLPGGGLFSRLRGLRLSCRKLPRPDLILAAGHATHLPLFLLARRHRARSVLLMKPSLPTRCFDLCLAPEHDFPDGAPADVITTLGALNRVTFQADAARDGGVLLVGGPSATHDWDQDAILDQLAGVCAGAPRGYWRLTTSRRTPPGMTGRLRQALPAVEVLDHTETDRNWLPDHLAQAAEVWVTEDSVSMIYEALSSGARVGLLAVPRRRQDNRILRGLDKLTARGFLTPYATWRETRRLSPPPHVLREADRCAKLVSDRLLPPRPDTPD